MPSLPELEVYKRDLGPKIIGQPIAQVEALDFRVVRAAVPALEQLLVGHAITDLDRYGKWLIASTGASKQLILHLGLTGKLHALEADAELPRHTAFVLRFADGRRFVLSDQRHLGKVYVRAFVELKAEKALGPDLLDLPPDYFAAQLAPLHRGLRDVLMDQKLIAGIGGKYADEILWQAKINPHTKFASLTPPQVAKLEQLTHTITEAAISLSAAVERFPSDWLIPHRHTDKTCPRCHGPLTEASAAFHCPHCQD